MELDELSHQAQELARQVQEDLQPAQACVSEGPVPFSSPPLQAVLDRIERHLIAVSGNMDTLIRRFSHDLVPLLYGIREASVGRLVAPNAGPVAPNAPQIPGRSPAGRMDLKEVIEALTPQERRVFQTCFQSGFLTYKEIARHLDTSATTAKNIVNRLFRDLDKQRLFQKKQSHGISRVALHPEVEKEILGTQAGEFRKNGLPVDARPSLPDHAKDPTRPAGRPVFPTEQTPLKERVEVF